MKKTGYIITVFLLMFAVNSCSKKTHPTVTKPPVSAEPVINPKVKPLKRAVPKVITVNDKAAKRSVDGRYYYDLEGHRYWRNNKDGKYYLFHKSMFENADFKSTAN